MTLEFADDKMNSLKEGELFFFGDIMNVLICDDEEQYAELLYVHVREYMRSRYINCTIQTATDPAVILSNDIRYDLVFLDIQMKGTDGITLAKELKSRNEKIALFFVTNYGEYQDEAMDLQALRYFSKPFDVNRLYSGLDKAMEYIDGSYIDIYLSGNGGLQRFIVEDILYVTRNLRKTQIKTITRLIDISGNFESICDKLPTSFFYLVHKSFYINLHYIDKYSYSEVYMTDGTRIAVAPRRQSAFHKYWFEYLRRR